MHRQRSTAYFLTESRFMQRGHRKEGSKALCVYALLSYFLSPRTGKGYSTNVVVVGGHLGRASI